MKLPITVTVWPSRLQPRGIVARSCGIARTKLFVLITPATSQVEPAGGAAFVGA